MRKKVNLPNNVLKEIENLLEISVGRYKTNVGEMKRQNSMENATTTISMVTKPMNARRNQNLKVNATNVEGMVTRHQNANPNHLI